MEAVAQAEDRDVHHSLLAHTSSQACYRSLYSLHLLSSGHVPSSIAGDSPRHSTLDRPQHLSRSLMSSRSVSTNICVGVCRCVCQPSSYLLLATRVPPQTLRVPRTLAASTFPFSELPEERELKIQTTKELNN